MQPLPSLRSVPISSNSSATIMRATRSATELKRSMTAIWLKALVILVNLLAVSYSASVAQSIRQNDVQVIEDIRKIGGRLQRSRVAPREQIVGIDFFMSWGEVTDDTLVKIKNRSYSQAEGRADFFDASRYSG